MHRLSIARPAANRARTSWPSRFLGARFESTRPIRSLLIANRGEIALRVNRTATENGIRTTTVFTDPDAQAQHALSSPFNANLGSTNAYLDGQRIIDIARQSGCDAIHPGYGFLSENAGFAKACDEAGIIFVGPPADAIEAMGNKSRSKEIMTAAGVPCIPGYHGKNQDPAYLEQQAGQIGYPVLIKAVKGGGGKGMRIVQTESEFASQLESAKMEARNSFGDDVMLVEKYINRPRHIEVQVFADSHGNCVALGERDCSVQRRHQKILEESPAPGLDPAVREELWAKARDAALAVGYRGAGTVEFIFDNDTSEFFFMEMNTRLQVEHPVTEMVTDTDLVRWQLAVAAGEKLPLTQDQIRDKIASRGHAIEARIYAESPERGFMPDSGRLLHVREPVTRHDSVRIDAGFAVGDDVSAHYDPMIAKLIVRGRDRTEALQKMRTALEEYEIAGPATNVEFLRRVCASDAFVQADLETGFIKKNEAELFEIRPVPDEVFAQAGLGLVLGASNGRKATQVLGFGASDIGFRQIDLVAVMRLTLDGQASLVRRSVTVGPSSAHRGRFDVTVSAPDTDNHDNHDVKPTTFTNVDASLSPALSSRSPVEIQSRGENVADHPPSSTSPSSTSVSRPRSVTVTSLFPHTRLATTLVRLDEPLSVLDPVLEPAAGLAVFHLGQTYRLAQVRPQWHAQAHRMHVSDGSSTTSSTGASGYSDADRARMVLAPMPCKVLRVHVKPGQEVAKNEPVVVVESMKMEMVIRASRDGIVKRIVHGEGDMCKAGMALVEFQEVRPAEKTEDQ